MPTGTVVDPGGPSGRLVALNRTAHTLVIAPYLSPDLVRTFAGLGIDASWPRQPGCIHTGGDGYFAARAAAFGASPAAVISAALYVHPDALVTNALFNVRRTADLDRVGSELLDLVGTLYGRLLGVSSREVEQTGDALRALVEGLSTSGRPSFAALASREWPRARWAQIWLSLALVVEHRNCTRYNAASGELTGAEYVAVHAARHGVAADEALSELGWPADAIDSTLDQLALRDLVIDDAVTANALAMLRELDFLAARAQREIAVRLDDNLDLDRLDAWGRVLQSSRDLCEPYRADSALALRVC